MKNTKIREFYYLVYYEWSVFRTNGSIQKKICIIHLPFFAQSCVLHKNTYSHVSYTCPKLAQIHYMHAIALVAKQLHMRNT